MIDKFFGRALFTFYDFSDKHSGKIRITGIAGKVNYFC